MSMRVPLGLFFVGAVAVLPSPASAQGVSARLERRRVETAVRQLVAQLPGAATGGTQSGTPSAAAPTTTDPTDAAAAPRPGKKISVSVDTRYGFDRQVVALGNPAFTAEAKRTIHSVNTTIGYPLTNTSSVFLSIPYIRQRATYTANFGSISQRGSGIGDIGIYLQKVFPPLGRGTELSASVGLITPTGKSPFETGPTELPTGVGFYQPVARLTLSKLRTPLRFYAAVDYGTSLKRTIGGTRVELPDSYGGELGFYYAMSPEFMTQTSVSYSKVTSPFIDVAGTNVGYLSQSLNYQANQRTSVRASVDVGLTEDSTDAYLGLSLNTNFN